MSSVDTIDKTERESGDTVSLRDFTDAKTEAIRGTIGIVSVKEYCDFKIAGLRDLYDARFEGQKESITVARDSMDKRLEGMNEFRQQMSDMSNKFATRDETNSNIKYLSDRVGVIESGLVTRQEHNSYQTSQSNQIATMQSRLTAIEAAKAGAHETKSDSRSDNTLLIATIGAATAVMVAVVAWNHTTPAAPVSTQPVIIQTQPQASTTATK